MPDTSVSRAAISDADLAAVLRASPDCVIVASDDGRVLEFNAAASATLGYTREAAIGRAVRDLIVPAAQRDAYGAMVERLIGTAAGSPGEHRGEFELMRADGSLFHAEIALTEARSGGRRLLTANIHEITARKQRESDARFLSGLGDRLRAESEGARVLHAATVALGEHLALSRVGYGEIDESAEKLTVTWDWTDGTVPNPPTPRVHDFDLFGPENVAAGTRGDLLVFEDIQTDPRTASYRPVYDALGIRALVVVPLTKLERFRAIFFIQRATPYVWTRREIDLACEVAERTWSTLERARAEAALRDSEAMLSAFMANAPIGMYVKDGAGRYLLANPEMSRVFGCPAGEVIGRTAEDLFTPDEAAVIATHDRALVASGTSSAIVEHLPGHDAFEWTLVVRFPITGDGAPRIGGFDIDISAQKRSENAALASDARFRLLTEFHPVPVAFMRLSDGRILAINPAASDMVRMPRGASAPDNQMWFETIAGQTRFWAAVTANASFDGFEIVMRRTDDELFWASVSWRWIEFDGEAAVVASFVDLTEIKNAQAELERSREALHQSEKMTALGSLLAGVSHELNNPLSIVVAQSMLLEELSEGSPLGERAAKVRKAAERCARIVQTFLAMARQKPPERISVDINEVVRAAVELTDYGIRTAGIHLDVTLAEAPACVLADADQLHQVVVNLLLNAQHALEDRPPPRTLGVAVRAAGPDSVEVVIADNGAGVPDHLRRRIFEPFFTTKPQGRGTGLGLSFSHGVVVAHGGSLDLGDSPDGAVFRIALPIARTPAAAAAGDPDRKPVGKRRGCVLVIDDEADIAGALHDILALDGYDVDIATGGLDAQRLLAAATYDYILSDLRMPDLDGPALFAWLSVERPELVDRIAFITGDTLGVSAVRFLAHAGRPVIEKPFTPAAVRALIASISLAA